MPLPTWIEVPLADIVQKIQYGFTAGAKKGNAGPRFLRITDIQDGRVDWGEVPTCDLDSEVLEKYRLHDGDIVFARTGATVGKSYLVRNPPDAIFASYLIRITPSKAILPKFLAAFFQSRKYWGQIEASKRGIGQPNVNGTVLAGLKIPVAPLAEQRRIVEAIEVQFTRLDAAVSALERLRIRLVRYRASLLAEGYRHASKTGTVPLRDIVAYVTDGDHQPPPQVPEGVPFVTIGDLVANGLALSTKRRVSPAYVESLDEKRRPRRGDVLYTVVGSFGIPIEVKTDEPFCVQRHIAILKRPLVAPHMLVRWLQAPQVYEQASRVATGTAQKTVGLSVLREIRVPKQTDEPSVSDELERRLSVADAVGGQVEAALKRCARLRQAVLRKAFDGRLVTHDRNDESLPSSPMQLNGSSRAKIPTEQDKLRLSAGEV